MTARRQEETTTQNQAALCSQHAAVCHLRVRRKLSSSSQHQHHRIHPTTSPDPQSASCDHFFFGARLRPLFVSVDFMGIGLGHRCCRTDVNSSTATLRIGATNIANMRVAGTRGADVHPNSQQAPPSTRWYASSKSQCHMLDWPAASYFLSQGAERQIGTVHLLVDSISHEHWDR